MATSNCIQKQQQIQFFQLMGCLKIIFFTLYLFQTIHAQNNCSPQSCGLNPLLVQFPFRLQGQHPQSCGYPGFDLSCTTQNSQSMVVLNLPYSGDFNVRNIDYLTQEIELYDPNGCLAKRLLDLNLSSSPFSPGYLQNYTFLSCPPEAVVGMHFDLIDCLSNSSASVLVTTSMNFARYMNMCSTIAAVSIPVSMSQDENWLSSKANGDLSLTWDVPDCQGCEAKGGTCGFQNSTSNQVLCFNEPDTGNSRGLWIFMIITLSIVAPAVVCALCITCFACIFERRAARISPPPPPLPPPPAAAAGLDDSTIESFTKVVLGESKRLPGPNGATCPICLLDYNPKDTLRCIPECEHCFHSDCIDEWLRLNSTCPVCRNSPSHPLGDCT